MKLKRPGENQIFEVEIIAVEPGLVRLRIDGDELTAGFAPLPDGTALLQLDGERIRVAGARTRNTIIATAGPAVIELVAIEGRASRATGGLAAPEVTAPMPGKVLRILVAEGDAVAAGAPLVVLEAMKMETTLYAEGAATVRRVAVAAGQMVDHGALLLELTPATSAPATRPSDD